LKQSMNGNKMTTIFLFSQNLKLESFADLKKYCKSDSKTILLTTHCLFDNEVKYLKSTIGEFESQRFSDYLTDSEQEKVDIEADNQNVNDVFDYYNQVRLIKNEKIADKISKKYPQSDKYLLCNDLGIDVKPWKKIGFVELQCQYYYNWSKIEEYKSKIKDVLKHVPILPSLYKKLRHTPEPYQDDVYSANFNGKKYVFIGRLQRVGYRIDLPFVQDLKEKDFLDKGVFHYKSECQYLSSIHERIKCTVPDSPKYDVRYIQDGYLPANYSACDLKYIPKNVSYYAWDQIGTLEFKKHNIPVSIMPFRKKLYIPEPEFKDKVKTILVATSGTGDWTAQKNRSDDDLMVLAFAEVARRCPDVKIIYRVHPTWIYPVHVGVNSINRVADYFAYTRLENIHLSSNIPNQKVLSFSRSSLEEDLKQADIVFGEHSVSMIDGAFKKIPFASVNLTDRRDLACSLTDMGFPHCKSVDEIISVIKNFSESDFQQKYLTAVKKYNEMTDCEL
ncbi:MAG: hypothetical protein IKP73_06585, partial [Bacteroidales bacterium]|nr:hypothetical protein [Bacteroidales bacterium]